MATITLLVRVKDPDFPNRLEIPADPGETLAEVLGRIHVQYHLAGMPADWRFVLGELSLPIDTEVRELPAGAELVLFRSGTSGIGMMPSPGWSGEGGRSYDLPGGVLAGLPSARPPAAPPRMPFPAPQAPAPKPAPPTPLGMPAPPPRAPFPAPSVPAPRPGGKMSRRAAPEPPDVWVGGVGDTDEYQLEDEVTHGMASRGVAVPLAERRATVRYYSRMNPLRTFPLLVILSAEQIAAVKKRAVRQAESAGFRVEEGSAVEVEPVLPGCACYPQRDTIRVSNEPVTATFWVVPQVLGSVPGARVIVRQNGAVLAEVPLDVKVKKQTTAVVLGLLGLASPYLMMGLRAAKLDYESQKADGFVGYQQLGTWALANVSPGWLGVALLVAAVGSYLLARPRRKDVFWEVKGPG